MGLSCAAHESKICTTCAPLSCCTAARGGTEGVGVLTAVEVLLHSGTGRLSEASAGRGVTKGYASLPAAAAAAGAGAAAGAAAFLQLPATCLVLDVRDDGVGQLLQQRVQHGGLTAHTHVKGQAWQVGG